MSTAVTPVKRPSSEIQPGELVRLISHKTGRSSRHYQRGILKRWIKPGKVAEVQPWQHKGTIELTVDQFTDWAARNAARRAEEAEAGEQDTDTTKDKPFVPPAEWYQEDPQYFPDEPEPESETPVAKTAKTKPQTNIDHDAQVLHDLLQEVREQKVALAEVNEEVQTAARLLQEAEQKQAQAQADLKKAQNALVERAQQLADEA